MKLYLSSYRIPTPEDLFDLIGKGPNATQVVVIENARDPDAPEVRKVKISDEEKDLQALGFNTNFLDLRNYQSAEELYEKLKNFDLVWAMGGNTFTLRHQMRRSGFEEAIKRLLKEGKVYGGESAGAIVAGNSLKGIELADDPKAAEEVINEGMKLVDKMILPHMDSPDFAEVMAKIVHLYKDDSTTIKLNDNQAYIINGESEQLATGD